MCSMLLNLPFPSKTGFGILQFLFLDLRCLWDSYSRLLLLDVVVPLFLLLFN